MVTKVGIAIFRNSLKIDDMKKLIKLVSQIAEKLKYLGNHPGIFLIIAFSFTACSTTDEVSDEKPNFIFIVIDDQNQDLACFGKPHVITPNIDKLAAQGVVFPNAYVQQAVCAASRASFLTGLHPRATGVEYPYSYYFVEEVIPKYGTIGQHFLKNGYYTRYFGKIHHGYSEVLSEPNYSPGGTRYVSEKNIEIDRTLGNAGVPPYEMFEGPDTLFKDGRIAQAVLEALEKAITKNEPFFFAVGFQKPHLPFSAPKKYWDLYEREEIPLVPNKYRPEGSPSIAFSRYNLNQYKWEHADPDRLFTDDYARLLRHAYFACTSFVDAQIGLIMEKVDELGLSNNTYYVYCSDHGFHMGEQNHYGKTSLHEANLKSPLIISHQELINQGVTASALVEYVDIFPTLMDLAGLPIPEHFEGISLDTLLANPDASFKKAVFSRQERESIGRRKGFSIRNERYRYTEWRNTVTGEILATELYDLQEDPLETVNMAMEESSKDLLAMMSKQLHDGWEAAVPDWIDRIARNPDAPPAYSHGREGIPRRKIWHEAYGGSEEDGWRKATEMRMLKEDSIRNAL
jgi:iduronate 2-sulfatase